MSLPPAQGGMVSAGGVHLGRDVFIASTSYVGGDVTLGDNCTVMHHVTIRGDIAPIRFGDRCNIQDGTVVHTKHSVPLEIGDDVGIGHRAVVHCRKVGSWVLIGIGSIVLDDCEIGDGSIIGAGAVLIPGTIVPPGKLVVGMPGRAVRDVTDRDRDYIRHVVESYCKLGPLHQAGKFPNVVATPSVCNGPG